ncbi:hypothetical protein RIF29_17585 [Crotalaria pallida]|uniref:Uncharacterized protein n=1 Tax=Crotalaria pallida TaxID=3830 RepID=A0AAN9IKG1_CROPI
MIVHRALFWFVIRIHHFFNCFPADLKALADSLMKRLYSFFVHSKLQGSCVCLDMLICVDIINCFSFLFPHFSLFLMNKRMY